MVNPIEHGTRLLCGDGKKLTLSFWARSSIADKRICPALQQQYGTGGSPSSLEYIKGVPITLTSSWTKYTHTFTTNTLSGKTFGTNNDDIVTCNLYYMWGETLGNSRLQSSVTAEDFGGSGTIDIAQVQLCAGQVALPFQPKSYEEELRACQRYYEKSASNNSSFAYANGTSIDMLPMGACSYKVTKRIAPTVVLYSYNGTSGSVSVVGATTDVNTSVTDVGNNTKGIGTVRGASNWTAGTVYWFGWTADAEL
jgi:hypothetical protein